MGVLEAQKAMANIPIYNSMSWLRVMLFSSARRRVSGIGEKGEHMTSENELVVARYQGKRMTILLLN